jgi:hypothetical protein
MANHRISFSFFGWNVGVLGDALKCELVKGSLLVNQPNLVLLQETKLADISSFKSTPFLPEFLRVFLSFDATGATRGLLMARNPTKFKLLTSFSKAFSISA